MRISRVPDTVPSRATTVGLRLQVLARVPARLGDARRHRRPRIAPPRADRSSSAITSQARSMLRATWSLGGASKVSGVSCADRMRSTLNVRSAPRSSSRPTR